MIEIELQQGVQSPQFVQLEGLPSRLGKGDSCDLVLSGLKIAKEHAEFYQGVSGLMIRQLGQAEIRVNHELASVYGPLSDSDIIELPGWRLKVRDPIGQASPSGQRRFCGQGKTNAEAVRRLRDLLDRDHRGWGQLSESALRAECLAIARERLQDFTAGLSAEDAEKKRSRWVAELIGYGPLEELMHDPSVTEIMVNAFDRIFVERDGVCELIPIGFDSESSLRSVVERMLTSAGRRIDDSSPMVDSRLPDGSRLNAVLAPPSVNGTCLTIRRFPSRGLQFDDLVRLGSFSEGMRGYLQEVVRARKNIVVSGGTGSGKTTLLRLLAGAISSHERIITIEDAAELNLELPNLVSLETRAQNQEGAGQIGIRDLVRNALRMRPDRIVVGECRGGEALDMLQAMNTGHEGSLTTVHANTTRDALYRLEVMVLMAGFDLPVQVIREQIASSVDIIIQQQRCSDGRRRVVAIDEVAGLESGVIQLEPIYAWKNSSFESFRFEESA
jgi:pilus assembly protein CpaF